MFFLITHNHTPLYVSLAYRMSFSRDREIGQKLDNCDNTLHSSLSIVIHSISLFRSTDTFSTFSKRSPSSVSLTHSASLSHPSPIDPSIHPLCVSPEGRISPRNPATIHFTLSLIHSPHHAPTLLYHHRVPPGGIIGSFRAGSTDSS